MPPRVLCSQVFFGAWYSISWLLNYSCGASTRCDGTTICIGEGSAPANEQQREAKHNLLHGGNHVRLWQWRLKPQIETSMVNRVLYTLSGSLGYGWFLKHFVSRPDIRETLRRQHQPSWSKRLLSPRTRRRYRSQRNDVSCNHVDCNCIWCRGNCCILG